jgi:hypothetical protein
MSIQISIPLEVACTPDVARALGELMAALCRTPELADLVAEAAGAGEGEARAATACPPGSAHCPEEPPPGGAGAAAHAGPEGEEERWAAFVASLPENSRRFVELLKSRGRLTITEAMQGLGVRQARAIGGVLGALARWGPARGVKLPFETNVTEAGERYWTWTGKG